MWRRGHDDQLQRAERSSTAAATARAATGSSVPTRNVRARSGARASRVRRAQLHDAGEDAEEDVGVDAALMGLVKDDRRVPAERRIVWYAIV